jgi:hypothetical protein
MWRCLKTLIFFLWYIKCIKFFSTKCVFFFRCVEMNCRTQFLVRMKSAVGKKKRWKMNEEGHQFEIVWEENRKYNENERMSFVCCDNICLMYSTLVSVYSFFYTVFFLLLLLNIKLAVSHSKNTPEKIYIFSFFSLPHTEFFLFSSQLWTTRKLKLLCT